MGRAGDRLVRGKLAAYDDAALERLLRTPDVSLAVRRVLEELPARGEVAPWGSHVARCLDHQQPPVVRWAVGRIVVVAVEQHIHQVEVQIKDFLDVIILIKLMIFSLNKVILLLIGILIHPKN